MRKTRTGRRKAMRKTQRKRGGDMVAPLNNGRSAPLKTHVLIRREPVNLKLYNSLSSSELENILEKTFAEALELKIACKNKCINKSCIKRHIQKIQNLFFHCL